MTLFDKLKKAVAQRSEPEWQPIVLEPDGFRSGNNRVKWSEVTEIAAFKRDMLTIDDVWFQFRADTAPVLVCEEQPGFAELEAKVIALFPSAASWRAQVIQPAFATNLTVLYSRT
ncbi:MAG: hypothetical protein JSR34_06715 [Proteobacteria bacterium]|nr:hypothetical protein [Pseudomonadota bacterium]